MRKPRTNTILLLATLLAVGFNGHAWLAGMPELSVRSATVSPTSLAGAVPSSRVVVAAGRASVVPATELAAARPQQLSADATVLVAEMCDLQLLAQGTELALDSSQWSALAAVVVRTQAIRQTYEAQIATATLIAPGQYRLEIPVYASVGDVLRRKFNAELRTELGEATAAEVVAELGDRLEGRFAGFGVSAQTLDITASPGGTSGDVLVTRTVTYWNSVEGGDRLTTRRETHFPAWEDPTGDSWSALLAKVKA